MNFTLNETEYKVDDLQQAVWRMINTICVFTTDYYSIFYR